MNLGTLPPLIFDVPWLLLAAVGLPLVVWWMRSVRSRQRRMRLARYAESSALRRLVMVADPDERGRTLRLVLIALLAGLALSGPRWGLARGPVSARGIDMAIAIDASLSMMAPDERPSRLERVKQEVRRLRAMSQADRVALIAFAGRSYILTPLTSDDGAIELFLDNLDPSVVGQAGSSIARAIRQGTELLLASDGSADRALVLMTDGEAFEPAEEVKAAATEAGVKGVSLVTVGFGTTQGSTIPIQDGSVMREKRDDDGKIVITRYSPELLEEAAKAAGGTFIPADASDKATRVRGALRSLRTAKRNVDSREDHVPRYLWLLLPALALLAYDTWWLTSRRALKDAASRGSSTMPPVALLLLLGALPVTLMSCKQAPDPAALFAEGNVQAAIAGSRAQIANGDTTVRTRYNLGTALIGADSLKAAAELLDLVRRDSDGETRMRARFNVGYTSLVMGRTPQNPEAEALLNSAAREERDVQGRKQRQGRTPPGGKDW